MKDERLCSQSKSSLLLDLNLLSHSQLLTKNHYRSRRFQEDYDHRFELPLNQANFKFFVLERKQCQRPYSMDHRLHFRIMCQSPLIPTMKMLPFLIPLRQNAVSKSQLISVQIHL
jgi:hypothetical protein